MVARKCSPKKLSKKFHKIHQGIPVLKSLSTVKCLQSTWPATLSKRDLRTGFSEPVVLRFFKLGFHYELTSVRIFF